MDLTTLRRCSVVLTALFLLVLVYGCGASGLSPICGSQSNKGSTAMIQTPSMPSRHPEDTTHTAETISITESADTLPMSETTDPPETLPPEETAPSPEAPPAAPEAPSSPWVMSLPQQGTPITPQPGDTTATWNPQCASMFPADEDCGDAMLLEKYLTVEGLSWADLSARGCRQLVLVVGTGENEAHITCYRREMQGWVAADHLTRMTGWTGKKGIAHDRKRNTLTSPAGLWALGEAFGNAPKPEGLHLLWRDVTGNSDWVCDDQSSYYNTWQERGDPALTDTWNHADVEHLEDYPESYAYACIIRYNTPPYTVPERGCAIFFHCAKGPTEGCIGLPEADFLRVLLWLDVEKMPYVLIVAGED